MMHPKTLHVILELTGEWLQNTDLSIITLLYEIPHRHQVPPEAFHVVEQYLTDIVRYWNALHFILQKTIRSLKLPPNQHSAWDYYAAYRILWDHIPVDDLQAEYDVLCTMFREFGRDLTRVQRVIRQLATFSWESALVGKTDPERLSLLEAMPRFLIDRLLPVLGSECIKAELHAMNRSMRDPGLMATLRFNTLVGDDLQARSENQTVKQIQADFSRLGVTLNQDEHFSFLFHVPVSQRELVVKQSWYKSGHVIFQEKASVATVTILDPQLGEQVFDLCAAPGLKTSLIAQFTANRAHILAGELKTGRAQKMRALMRQLNALNIHLVNCDNTKTPFRELNIVDSFDRVLVDAPCMGSGTFLSDPDLKWQQKERFLYRNVIAQRRLLERSINLVRPGGVVVFSTCSFYPEEGEQQILHILRLNKWKGRLEFLPLPEWIAPPYQFPGLPEVGCGRLFPALNGTQGFFFAKFRRTS